MIPGANLALAYLAVAAWLSLIYLATLRRRLTDLIDHISHTS